MDLCRERQGVDGSSQVLYSEVMDCCALKLAPESWDIVLDKVDLETASCSASMVSMRMLTPI